MQCAYICMQDVCGAPLGEDESYNAENLRRIARSLSGTVIGGRADSVPPSRSFVGVLHNLVTCSKMPHIMHSKYI